MNQPRTDKEIMGLILKFARQDERIRVVGLNGSRVNSNAPKDRYQDYDVAFLVTDMESFKKGDHWLHVFGPRIIIQKPEAMSLFPPTLGNWFSYLMLLEDGNRIDIMLIPINELDVYLKDDSLTMILLDKDKIVSHLPEPSDETHWVKKPSPQYVHDCCNEFWWLATYVAKGLLRREILYAIDHLYLMRQQLLTMISWKVGLENYFSVSIGKNLKYLADFIPADEFASLLATYSNNSLTAVAESSNNCQALFRSVSRFVSDEMGYAYPDYDEKVTGYLNSLNIGSALR